LPYSFQPHYGHGIGSFSNRNGYQKYFLGIKGRPVFRAVNLTTSMCRLS